MFAQISTNIDKQLIENADAGHLEKVIKLLKRGANVHAYDDAALIMSAQRGYSRIVTVLLKNGANVHADGDAVLRASIVNFNVETVIVLLEYGANANAQIKYRSRYIHCLNLVIYKYFAATTVNIANDCLKIIAKLLECGSDVYAMNKYILKQIKKTFSKDLADIILPYCQSDDYCFFPDAYIKERIVPTKGSR